MSSGAPEKRILCVEDNPDICELIAAILTDFEVIPAAGVGEGCNLYNNDEYSRIILDYHLTDGDGLMLCKYIRAKDPEIPIIFITADADLSEDLVLDAGAQRLISKASLRFMDELLESVA
jgi:two-component system OmpR family response regulator